MASVNIWQRFLIERITCYNGQWYCYICMSTLQSLEEVEYHLQNARSKISHQIFLEKWQMSDFLNNVLKLSNMKCKELLNHGIVIRDCQEDYFCVSCQCSLLSLYDLDEHLEKESHKNCIQVITENMTKKIEIINKNMSPLKYFEEINYNVILNEKLTDLTFCGLCDDFIYKSYIEDHTSNIHHVARKFKLDIFEDFAIYVYFEKERKIEPLHLNSRKLDGTIWPENSNKNLIAMYKCDVCNIMIEENNVINHEITIHKISALKYVDKWLLYHITPIDSIQINISSTSILFKCSICNELMHGIFVLEYHCIKHEHQTNLEVLGKNKEQKSDNRENVRCYLELFEFLSIIFFENNGETMQPMEQPVIYIKNDYRNFNKSLSNSLQDKMEFKYICIACNKIFESTYEVFKHLGSERKHIAHYRNVLRSYNCGRQDIPVPALNEHNINIGRQVMKFPVSTENISMDTSQQVNVNETQTQIEYANIVNLMLSDSQNDKVHSYTNTIGLYSSFDTDLKIGMTQIPWEKTRVIGWKRVERYRLENEMREDTHWEVQGTRICKLSGKEKETWKHTWVESKEIRRWRAGWQ